MVLYRVFGCLFGSVFVSFSHGFYSESSVIAGRGVSVVLTGSFRS